MKFVNLYVQSEYTRLASALRLETIVEHARAAGNKYVALADSGLYGAVKFAELAKNAGLTPIIGAQVPVDAGGRPMPVVLFVRNEQGYKNLCRLLTVRAHNEMIGFLDLEKYHGGLNCVLPASDSGLLRLVREDAAQAAGVLNSFQAIFPVLYFGLGLQSPAEVAATPLALEFAKAHALTPIAFNKASYETPADAEVYLALKAIDELSSDVTLSERERNQYLLSPAEGAERFKDYPELVVNSAQLCADCRFQFQFTGYKMARYPVADAKRYLQEQALKGLKWRLQTPTIPEPYAQRLQYELAIIDQMGFNDYFLVVWDYIRFAKHRQILVGPGRGSAPGSLVSYSLAITDIDPLKHDLLFERFLNPERNTMPDIDVDIPDDRREEVIAYLIKKYGETQVAHITTFNTFGVKAALRDIARYLAYPAQRFNRILRLIPSTVRSFAELLKEGSEISRLIAQDEEAARLFNLAERIFGLTRNYSVHAAGIIMADCDLTNYSPLDLGSDGTFQTQLPAEDLEKLGLVKMDVLGLKNLTIIADVLKSLQRANITIDLLALPENDPETFQYLARGDTDGIFQFESPGMRNTLIKLRASSFEDLVVTNAIFRPGPMEMIPEYCARKFGKKYQVIADNLRPILDATYGIIVYQEQVMQIASLYAGYNLGAADILRRAIAKKNKALMHKERERFVKASVARGKPQAEAAAIFDYIEKFASYGFNKSHSVAYSLIAYQMAYLKAHFFPHFICALLNSNLNSASIMNYVNMARARGVSVKGPDINKSTLEFIYDTALYFPLTAVAQIGTVKAEALLAARAAGPFGDFADFVVRTQKVINSTLFENLVYSGALDCFGHNKAELLANYEQTLMNAKFAGFIKSKAVATWQTVPEESFATLQAKELAALGINLTYDLGKTLAVEEAKRGLKSLGDFQPGERGNFLAIITRVREIKTKSGQAMAFCDLETGSGPVSGVLFPRAWRICQPRITGDAQIIAGQLELRNGEKQVVIESVFPLS